MIEAKPGKDGISGTSGMRSLTVAAGFGPIAFFPRGAGAVSLYSGGRMSWDGIHDLVRRAKAGDGDAWRRLYDLAQPYLLGQAQRLIGRGWQTLTLNELVQDTWLKAFRGLGHFRGGDTDADTGAAIRAWLKLVMRSVALNHARRPTLPGEPVRAAADGSSDGFDPPARVNSPSSPLRTDEARERLEQALARLTPADRDLLERYYFRGETVKAIAADLGLDYNQACDRMKAIRQRLGEELREWP